MQRAVVIGGPTASGKSSLAVSLAAAYNGVVINADSLQIYDALPILTAQPSAAERSAVPHALYGVVHPDAAMTAQSWRLAAVTAMESAAHENRLPIIVGGTGFYINTLLQGMSPLPEIPATARAAAEAIYHEEGLAALHARLMAADPLGTARLDAQNPQRLIRAYEVLLHTGKPISYWQAQPRQGPPSGWQFLTIALLPPREILQHNCAARIDTMVAQGALDEIAAFNARLAHGEISATAPVTHACGYAPLSAHLRGEMSLDESLTAMLIDTRQYARRQDTWFRRQWQPDITLATAQAENVQANLEKFLAL